MKSKQNNKVNNYILMGTLLGIAAVTLVGNILMTNSKRITDSLAQEIIRFHVVANSDTVEDQLLKQQIKDEVIEYMEPLVKESKDIDETRSIVGDNLDEIQEIAESTVLDYGKDYEIYISLDKANFPTKSYGDIVFPAGEYEACRIVIGEGKGENWWCVMYPPLCYIDAASGVVPLEGKEQLQEELSDEQYQLVANNQTNGKYQIRFKIIDTINSVFCKSNYKDR
ncbi:MAG: stage II sporulation protein R [Cellulosilyticum sp.]|nr:stage II sporulation protein R [Cellulosilyticum sp.]